MEEQRETKHRRGWRRRLYYLVGMLLATCVGLAVILGVISMKNDNNDDNDVIRQRRSALSLQSSRNVIAEAVLEAMDKSVEPCEDFYQYSCGGWIRANPIPKGYSRYTRFHEAIDKVNQKLKELLDKPHDKNSEGNSIRKAKDMYQSCINENEMDKRGVQPLKDLITAEFAGWSLTTSGGRRSIRTDVESLLARLGLLEVFPLLNLYIMTSLHDSSQYLIWIDQPPLGLDRIHLIKGRNSEEVKAYKKMRRQQAMHMFGLSQNSTKKIVRQIVDFENKLAKMSASNGDRRDRGKFYKTMTVSQLKQLTPQFDWNKFLSTYFGAAANITITDDTTVAMFAENYTKSMVELLDDTDAGTVDNYLLMRLVGEYAGFLSTEIRDLNKPLDMVLKGVNDTKARWKTCLDQLLDQFMPTAIGQLYASDYFKPSAKRKVLEMIGYVQGSMNEMIKNVGWMDSTTKNKALEKAGAIVKKIGYPDYQFNNTVMESLYGDLNVKPNTYFENVVSSIRSYLKQEANKLKRTHSSEDWSRSAAVVNAYYSPSENSIMFPAGILQPPFYSEDFPMSMMFGGIGAVIGHEITHGFDDQGRKYDKEGKHHQWWSETSINNFKNLSSCFVDQYGKEIVAGFKVDGKNTLGENIGDNGGLKAAYLGYKKWLSSNTEQRQLPGLGLTDEQLYFVSFAQIWCSRYQTESLEQHVRKNPHSPPSVRARLPAANFDAFAKAFNCSAGSAMNPTKKCTLW